MKYIIEYDTYNRYYYIVEQVVGGLKSTGFRYKSSSWAQKKLDKLNA